MEITTSEEGLHEIPEDEVRAKVEKDFSHFLNATSTLTMNSFNL
tara:strand:- start:254 stop:385 length:132 start_codon:yes stop_codon:yes gene_type:complete